MRTTTKKPTTAGRLRLALGCSVLAGLVGCGAGRTAAPTNPASPEPAVVLELAGDTPAEEVAAVLATRLEKAGFPGRNCALLWGDVRADYPRARLRVGGEFALDGWVACGDRLEQCTKDDPRVHQVGLVRMRASGLCVSHPSGPGCHPLDLSAPATPEKSDRRTFGRFLVETKDGVTAEQLVPILTGLPRWFVWVQWILA